MGFWRGLRTFLAPAPAPERARLAAAARRLWGRRPRTLIVVAHPDDAEAYFGAFLLRWLGKGGRAVLAVATNGEKNCIDPGMGPKDIVKTRQAEQKRAARLAGVDKVFFLGFPDGKVEEKKFRLVDRLIALIREVRPAEIWTFDPTCVFMGPRSFGGPINHPDHRAAGDAAISAASFGSGLARFGRRADAKSAGPWPARRLLLAVPSRPNLRFDPGPYLARKKRLLELYSSQFDGRAVRRALAATERSFRRVRLS